MRLEHRIAVTKTTKIATYTCYLRNLCAIMISGGRARRLQGNGDDMEASEQRQWRAQHWRRAHACAMGMGHTRTRTLASACVCNGHEAYTRTLAHTRKLAYLCMGAYTRTLTHMPMCMGHTRTHWHMYVWLSAEIFQHGVEELGAIVCKCLWKQSCSNVVVFFSAMDSALWMSTLPINSRQ